MTAVPSKKKLAPGVIGIEREQLPPLSPEAGPIDLHRWFAEDGTKQDAPPRRPLELEIGSGKGTFLVEQARAQPHVNHIGLEYARAYWRYAADRLRRRNLTNVRVVRVEAELFVRNYVPDGTFRQIHIYFPDPWPKKRHHKRRLIQTPFLRALHRILEQPEAQAAETDAAPHPVPLPPMVRLATDHGPYFEWMLEHAARVPELFEIRPFASPRAAAGGELVGTNFERKYRQEGRPFHGMVLAKRP